MSCNRDQAIANFGNYATSGNHLSDSHKEAISNGVNASEKYKSSYSSRVSNIRSWHAANKGAWKGKTKVRTPAHNAKIGAAQKGKPKSAETRRRMSEGAKRKIRNDPEAWAVHVGKMVGGCRTSKPRRYLYNAICRLFGEAEIEKNVPFTTRFADIWVPNVFVDVEFDSKFWHECSMHSGDYKRDTELEEVGVPTIRIGYEELGTPYEISKTFMER